MEGCAETKAFLIYAGNGQKSHESKIKFDCKRKEGEKL